MKYCINGFILLLMLPIFNVYGISHISLPDGKLNVIIKNNKPCIYVDRNDLTGRYMMRIAYSDKVSNEYKFWYRISSFEKEYPNQEKCILADKENFPNIKLTNGTIYNFLLESASIGGDDKYVQNNFNHFIGSYCFKNIEGNDAVTIQEFDPQKNKCIDKVKISYPAAEEKYTGWLGYIIRWINDLWESM